MNRRVLCFIVAAILATGTVYFSLIAGALRVTFNGQNVNHLVAGARVSLRDAGSPIDPLQAEKLLGVKVLPAYLPAGTEIYQARLKEGALTIVFRNPNLRRLPFFEDDVEILLFISRRPLPQPSTATIVTRTYTVVKEGHITTITVTQSAPNYWSMVLRKIEVNGNPGYAAESMGNVPAIVIWHDGNYTYTLRAYLPVEELIKIANSINPENSG